MTSRSEFHIDFETRSECDLTKAGAYAYAKHPSTIVTRLGWSYMGEKGVWVLGEDPSSLVPLTNAVARKVRGVAHNASFELVVWNLAFRRQFLEAGIVIPPLHITQMSCTQARALAMGLPPSLEKLGTFLGTDVQKDMSGRRLMLKMSKPWKKEPTQEEQDRLTAYCATDVETEEEIDTLVLPLSESEQKIWELDQKINNYGFKVDLEAAKKAMLVAEIAKEHIAVKFNALTGIKTPNKTKQLLTWLWEVQGVEIPDLKKTTLDTWMGKDDLPPAAIEALKCRKDFSKAATAKIKRIVQAESGGRVRGLTQYHGAGTGRFAGRSVQFQNLFKSKLSEVELEWLFETVKELSPEDAYQAIAAKHADVMACLAGMTRGMFIADEDSELIVADWSNIEGRVLAILAGEGWVIEAFREFDTRLTVDGAWIEFLDSYKEIYEWALDEKKKEITLGPDLYIKNYASTFNISEKEVTKLQRNIGKILTLSLGYQGSIGAWRKMTAGNRDLPFFSDEEIKEIVMMWRGANRNIVKLWHSLHKASILAVQNPGQPYLGTPMGCPPVIYSYQEGYLICQLPSGRNMFYPKARLEETTFGGLEVVYSCVKNGKAKDVWLYPGILAENVTQAVARDILTHSLVELDKLQGIKIAAHVHDEVVCNRKLTSTTTLRDMERIMSTPPEWAKGWPLAVKGWSGPRFKKDD